MGSGTTPATERVPVVDGHNDLLLALEFGAGERSFSERSEAGHLDLPRAREGGLAAGFFAAFVPDRAGDADAIDTDFDDLPDPLDRDVAVATTGRMLSRLHRLAADSDGAFRVVGDVDDLDACLAGEAVGAIPHLEGAAAVAPDRSNLDLLYAAGVRSIGLVWSRPNAFGEGVPFRHPASPDTGPGLTDAGRDLVAACNDRGVLVDCAHLNERGFWDVAAVTEAPLVVTHAGVHDICPTARNLTDEQIDAVADADGVVGVTFAVAHLRPDGETDADTPVSVLADHVEYVADRVGVEHVALGSDFDGATVPGGVGDVAGLPSVLTELRTRGFTDDDLAAVAHGNWRRVLAATWRR